MLKGFYGNEVGPEEVLKVFTKAYDMGANGIILIAVPKMGENAGRLADHYKIRWMEAWMFPRPEGKLTGTRTF